MDIQKYRTLLFDLDDTLLDYSGDERRCISKVFENNGIPFSEDVAELYYGIDGWQNFDLGSISPQSIISDHFCRLCKMLCVDKRQIPQLCQEFYTLMLGSHKLKYGALSTLRALKEKGYRIFIASNGFSGFSRKRIKDAKIQKYIDGVFISEELDVRKPNKVYFDKVISRIGESNRKNILIIGDAPTTDVLSGINSGIDVCLVNDKNRHCSLKHKYEVTGLKSLLQIL